MPEIRTRVFLERREMEGQHPAVLPQHASRQDDLSGHLRADETAVGHLRILRRPLKKTTRA
jgi:hypothetical protein